MLVVGLVVGALLLGCGPASPPPVAPAQPVFEVPKLDASRSNGDAPIAGVRIRRMQPAVGMKWTASVRAESDAPEPQGGTQRSTYASDYAVEVLAVDGPAIASVRVRFDRNVQTYQGAETPTPIHGKTYVVARTPPFVRDAGGSSVSEQEAQRVLDVFPDIGTRSRVDEVLPDDPMSIGDRRDELAAAILRTIHPRAWTLEKGRATFVREAREREPAAVFDLVIEATSDSGLAMKLGGECSVRLADARLTSLKLVGTYTTAKARDETGQLRLQRTVGD